eukprot:174532_1
MQIGSIFVEAGSMFVLNSTNTAIKIGIKDKIEKVVGIDTNDDIQYKRLCVEAVPQLRLYLKDPLNKNHSGAETISAQTMERNQSVCKKLFYNHMNKSDEDAGIQTIFIYYHIRMALGVKYGIWNIKTKSSSLHWRDEDSATILNPDQFELPSELEMPSELEPPTLAKLFTIVKDAMRTNIAPALFLNGSGDDEEKGEFAESKQETDDDEDYGDEFDGLEVRNADELQFYDSSDDESDIDDAFLD